jgi:carbamoyl-phosphate synthase large subunit
MPYPGAGPEALLKRIDEIRENHHIDLIVPCLDSEIPNYITLAKEFRSRKILLSLPRPQSFERRLKDQMGRLGKKTGVLVPSTFVAPDLASAYYWGSFVGYPLILKGKHYEARRVGSPAALAEAFYSITAAWGGPVLVQEFVVGIEYDVIGLGDGKGGIVGSCSIRKLLLTEAGKAFSGIVVADPELDAQVARIIVELKWNGPFELEFIWRVGEFMLIEMNPRFPAWCDFPSQIGCNLPAALVEQMMVGTTTPLRMIEPGRMFIRHSVDLVGDISDVAELSMTGAISRELNSVRSEIAR